MIAAGLGFRDGAEPADFIAAVEAALDAARLPHSALSRLAAPETKAAHAGLTEAAERLALPLTAVPLASMHASAPGCATRSVRALALFGVPSVAEACALAAAGRDARLVQPRLALGPATCALAEGGP